MNMKWMSSDFSNQSIGESCKLNLWDGFPKGKEGDGVGSALVSVIQLKGQRRMTGL